MIFSIAVKTKKAMSILRLSAIKLPHHITWHNLRGWVATQIKQTELGWLLIDCSSNPNFNQFHVHSNSVANSSYNSSYNLSQSLHQSISNANNYIKLYENKNFYGNNYQIVRFTPDLLFDVKVQSVKPYSLKKHWHQLINQSHETVPIMNFESFNKEIFDQKASKKIHYGHFNATSSEMNVLATKGYLGCFKSSDMWGINNTWGIPGSRGAYFDWHSEDEELCAFNYVIAGHPKIWYAIKPADHFRACAG